MSEENNGILINKRENEKINEQQCNNTNNNYYEEPLGYNFLTEEDHRNYNNFIKFCKDNFAYIDMRDINRVINKLREGPNKDYFCNYISSSDESDMDDNKKSNTNVDYIDHDENHTNGHKKKKIKDYRKNLKLINIKKNKRARINLIVIKKKYLNDNNNNNSDNNKNSDNNYNNNNNNHHSYNSERTEKNTIILSPIFMPVGTKCCIKGLTLENVNDICDYIILSNTYHLSNIYDMSIFQYNKDINNLIKFPNAMLTDSGGFQMVSLSKRIKILEEGILFNNIYNSEVIKKNMKICNVEDIVKRTCEEVGNDMCNNMVVHDNVTDETSNEINKKISNEINKNISNEINKKISNEINKNISATTHDNTNEHHPCDSKKYLEEGEDILLSPEISIRLQNFIGSDIIMALDDVRSSLEENKNKIEEATHRTNRWLKRCIDIHKKKEEQSLFGIVQGGLHIDLRNISMDFILRQKLNGYAVGGLCGGEKKTKFIEIINHCSNEKNKKYNYLPINKCRYIMGIGYIVDIIFCSLFGYDMYDCVYPSRTARFNTAVSFDGTIKLKQSKYKYDFSRLEKNCNCYVCLKYTKASLHFLISKRNTITNVLLTLHNIYFTLYMCHLMKVAIFSNKLDQFITTFLYNHFVIGVKNGNYKIPCPDENENKMSNHHNINTNDINKNDMKGKNYQQATQNLNIKQKNMIQELKRNLPQWVVQALEYADIELMF
ncbi:queuine tRNA-ribosyltransferase, putative [Plasmodium sp. gorilla clade G2]|uniref:queuine tRNA-ribosyltransferase, putative n=1 Tax=Plasmodium sp. gorilla clade G2 TaxID=880535 RepID=UPI000D21A560|nr:queuine tRNA-ribosyltransferase, putative [Plasmodium sp. gorilla clade G2]SOV13079.1 queuine tRNA-ribosyltransferase, putative [Plasmodium sp. gorilla clade G2]